MNPPLLTSEPDFGPWTRVPVVEVAALLTDANQRLERRGIIAVDGRSGGGKTTAAGLLEAAIEDSSIIHTDDIAWHHSFFGWSDLMIEGVLKPARAGELVDYRPPAWIERERRGSIRLSADTRWVILEGVGAARHELMPYIDSVVWVQSDFGKARSRGIERDGDDRAAESFWDEWMEEELPFFEEHSPWKRATVVINGTPASHVESGMEVATSFCDKMNV